MSTGVEPPERYEVYTRTTTDTPRVHLCLLLCKSRPRDKWVSVGYSITTPRPIYVKTRGPVVSSITPVRPVFVYGTRISPRTWDLPYYYCRGTDPRIPHGVRRLYRDY